MITKIKPQQLSEFIKKGLSTHHGRVLGLVFLAALFYLPTFLSIIGRDILKGSAAVILNAGLLYLGCSKLYQSRAEIKAKVLSDDRMIGHLLIIGGTFWLPFCYSSASLQALIFAFIIIGAAWSSFSPAVFGRFPLAWSMILVGLYPDIEFISGQLIKAFTGRYFFENLMAQIGTAVLQLMGQPAVTQGKFIVLPEGSVEVAFGCTGFDMAVVLSGVSFLLGLYLELPSKKIVLAVLYSLIIAFLLNIPRIVLLAFAAVYWGEDSFNFWHGFWGGQIFSGIMFTVYYYMIMAVYSLNPKPAKRA